MRRLVVGAALLLASCGGEHTAAEPAPASSRTATTEPVPSTRNIITEGVHDKRVGQPGIRMLRIEVDVKAPLAFQCGPPVTALQLSHWAIETADGSVQSNLQMVDACSPDPGVFVAPLVPATHPRDSVVVIAPTAATWLWMKYEQTAYRWPVRPPV